MTAPTTDRLTVHRAVLQAAGPEALAAIVHPLTADEYADVAAFLDAAECLPDADVASFAGLPEGDVPQLRRLLTEDGSR